MEHTGGDSTQVAAAAMHQTKAAMFDGTHPTLVPGAAALDNRHRKRRESLVRPGLDMAGLDFTDSKATSPVAPRSPVAAKS